MIAVGLILSATAVCAADVAEKKTVTFEKEIGPLFQQACVQCHGSQKAKAGLRLDTLEEVKKGAEGSQVLVVGDAGKSKLVKMITRVGKNGGYAHPPRHPLTEDQINLIKNWINQGAK